VTGGSASTGLREAGQWPTEQGSGLEGNWLMGMGWPEQSMRLPGRRRDMGREDGMGGWGTRWGREGAEIFDEAMNRGRRRCVRACGIHGQET
jgi:hypothetical protein